MKEQSVILSANEGGLRIQGHFKKSLPNKPLITVITVVFNAEKHLEETILSVLNQAYGNIEYLIIDGGSTDGTLKIIKQYDGLIDYWLSEPDSGIYDAMNKGWMLATENSCILFIGAGDRIVKIPEKVFEDKIIHGRVEIGAGRFYVSRGDWPLQFGNTLHHQALLIPKKYASDPPFNTAYPLYADFDFNQRLRRQGYEFVRDDLFTSFALPGGMSAKLDAMQMATIVYSNHGLFFALITYMYCTYQKLKHDI
jgi:glycosyltransferase involved in cell wall biosynthesis